MRLIVRPFGFAAIFFYMLVVGSAGAGAQSLVLFSSDGSSLPSDSCAWASPYNSREISSEGNPAPSIEFKRYPQGGAEPYIWPGLTSTQVFHGTTDIFIDGNSYPFIGFGTLGGTCDTRTRLPMPYVTYSTYHHWMDVYQNDAAGNQYGQQFPYTMPIGQWVTLDFTLIPNTGGFYEYVLKMDGVVVAVGRSYAQIEDNEQLGVMIGIGSGAGTDNARFDNIKAEVLDSTPQGLVGFWKFDGDFRDSSAYANDAVPQGTPIFGEGRLGGQGLNLKASSYLTVPTTSSLALDDFTIEAWVKLDSIAVGSGQAILIKQGPGEDEAANENYGLMVHSNGDLGAEFETAVSGGQDQSLHSTSQLTVGNWSHVAGTYNSTTKELKTYINGVLVGTKIADAYPPNVNNWDISIGSSYASYPNQPLGGIIDELMLWNVARTPSEIQADMKGLVGFWKFDGDFRDSSTYANDAVSHGTPTFNQGRLGSQGLSLNGSSYLTVPTASSLALDDFTIEAWVKLDSIAVGSGQAILIKQGPGEDQARNENYGLMVHNNGDLGVEFETAVSGGQDQSLHSTSQLTAGNWSHVAGTYNSTTKELKTYINGVLAGTKIADAYPPNVNNWDISIGSSYASYLNQPLGGTIDELMLWNMARTPSEIQADMNSTPQIVPTSTSISTSANPATYGQPVTITATVSAAAGTPTGTVTFVDGPTTLGTSPLDGSGQAVLSVSTLSTGSHSISANYSGDAHFASSGSQPFWQTVQKATPTITWSNPADIVYGTPLSSTQLNASVSLSGILVYAPSAGSILNAGNNQTLSVAFTPADTVNYNPASKSVSLNVLKATPTITWDSPVDITHGTPLSSTQLNATASVSGAFVYTPSIGTVLSAGNSQTLSVEFTPNDPTDYTTATASVTINVLSGITVRLTDSHNNGMAGASVQYYSGGWKPFGTTGSDGQVFKQIDLLTYTFRVTYGGVSIDKSQNTGTNPIVVFQTTNVTVRLKDSSGAPLDVGSVQYYGSSWISFGTTSGGQVAKELLPGTYSFRITYAGTSNDKSQNVGTNPVVEFQTMNVSAQLKDSSGAPLDVGSVQYYGSRWISFGTTSGGQVAKELLPGTYSFRITYAGTSNDKSQNVGTNPVVEFQTVNVSARLKDSSGAPLDVGSVQYYGSSWLTFGTTAGGQTSKELLPGTYSFRMTYAGTSNDKSQNVGTNPVVEFQTVNVSASLKDSSGAPLDVGSVQYYGGSWLAFGTTSGGQTSKELLPGTYSFRMTYAGASNDKSQDVSSNSQVIFQTGKVVSTSNTCTSYYANGWRTFTNGMELLPAAYSFRFVDYPDTPYTIAAGISNSIH